MAKKRNEKEELCRCCKLRNCANKILERKLSPAICEREAEIADGNSYRKAITRSAEKDGRSSPRIDEECEDACNQETEVENGVNTFF